MENIYNIQKKENVSICKHFLTVFALVALLLTGASFSANTQTTFNVAGTDVCEGGAASIGLNGSVYNSIYHLLLTTDDINYTWVTAQIGQGPAGQEFDWPVGYLPQNAVGKYEVYQYDVYVTDPAVIINNGVKQTGDVNIYADPVPEITGELNPCANSTFTYTTEAGHSNYSWSIDGGIGTSTSNTIDVTWDNATGAGSVEVTYDESHPDGVTCTGTSSISIDVDGVAQVVGGNIYCSIQDAIDAASDNDVINVFAGTHNETLDVNKAGLTIQGVDRNAVIINSVGLATNNAGIYVNADGVTIESLTLQSTATNSLPRYGIKFGEVDGCSLEDVSVQDVYRSGIDAIGSSNLTINNIESHNNGGHGLALTDCNGVDVSNVTFSNNAWQNISVATWGRYSPLGTSDIVFSGSNSFGNLFQLEMGDYNNSGVVPSGDAIITYSANITDGADVTVQSSDFGFAVHGTQDDAPDQFRIWFMDNLADSKTLIGAAPVGHFTGEDMFIEDLVNTDQYYVPIGGTIQAAIVAASPGDDVNVDPGIFNENLSINKGLNLLGTGSAQTILRAGAGIAIDVTGDDVTVDGFEVQHTAIATLADMGILLSECNNAIIQNNKFTSNSLGIQLLDAGSNQIFDNTFDSNAVGIYFEGTTDGVNTDVGSNGPFYSLSLNNTVDGNTITNSIIVGSEGGIGIYIDAACESNIFNDNTVTNSAGPGYFAWKASNNTLTNNTFSDNGSEGVHLFGSSGNTISGNTVGSNATNGFLLRAGALSVSGNNITGNTITGNGVGIKMEDDFSSNNYVGVITGNTISNNDISGNTTLGLQVSYVATGTVIDATCNWWGTASYETIGTAIDGPVVFTSFLTSDVLDPGICDGGPAVISNLTLTYEEGSENIKVEFDVEDNDFQLQPIPGLDPENDLAAIYALYGDLETALAGTDENAKQAAALATGDDVIISYYYMDGGTKVYLKTINNNDLIKNKYWQEYLSRTSDGQRYTDWVNGVTLMPKGFTYVTNTNPGTGTVSAGWLNDVLGKTVTVEIAYINNGHVTVIDEQLTIDAGCIVNTSTSLGYPTIQDAIDAASDYDVIEVCAGTFNETLVINKPLTINGTNTILDIASANTYGVLIQADDVVFDGFTINSSASNNNYAIHSSPGITNLAISNVTINNSGRTGLDLNGLVSTTGSPSVISNVTVNNSSSGFGLALSGTDGVEVSNLTTSGNAWGSVGIWANAYDDQPDNIKFLNAVTSDEGGIQIQQDESSDPIITFSTVEPTDALYNANAQVIVPSSYNRDVYSVRSSDGLNDHFLVPDAGAISLAQALVASGTWVETTIRNLSAGEWIVAETMLIQDAISQAAPTNNILVLAGTYAENVEVNKALVLNGANEDVACGSRGAESKIAPAGGLPLSLTADGVTINGFEITAPANTYAINGSNTSNLNILFNNIHDVGSSLSSGYVHSVVYQVADGVSTTNVFITDNCFETIGNSSLSGASASAIGILDSEATGVLSNLKIERNTINNVTVNTGTWPAGKIAYGIQLNTGSANYTTTDGKIVGAQIKDNNITNLTGFISTGIALEGNTENAEVSGNTVSNLTGYKFSGDRAGGAYDLQALKFESNRYVSTVTVENNFFETNTFTFGASATENGYAVANYVPMADGGIAELGCNWYGTADYGELVAEYTNYTGKIFNKVGAGTDFTTYSTSASAINCDGGNAIPDNLTLVYDQAAENVKVQFDVTGNSAMIYPIPRLNDPINDYAAIVAKYDALETAVTSGTAADIKAAALEIGDDIITEYYYMDGGNKVYLQTAGGNPLTKNKYWDQYLNNTSNTDRYPDFAVPRFEVPISTLSTSTNPNTGGTVNSGWLNPVYGKDLNVKVTVIHNGTINSDTKSVTIDAAPVQNLNTEKWYLTIQDAIDDTETQNGHTISVAPGTFAQNLTVNKELTFQGANMGTPGYDARSSESTIEGYVKISAKNVSFDGFKLLNGASILGQKAGFYISTAVDNTTLKNNFVIKTDGLAPSAGDTYRGILNEISGISDITVEYNKFEGWATGVYLQHASSATVQNNVFFENFVGMSNDFPEGVSISENEFTDNGVEGIGIGGTFNASGININSNKITGSTTGVANWGTTTVDATCNWWGSDQYADVAASTSGPVIYASFLENSTINPLDANYSCTGSPATPTNLTVDYVESGENIKVDFDVTIGDLDMQPVPGLDPNDPTDYATIKGLYEDLGVALASNDQTAIQAAALALGDDVITEYYYLDGGNKVYLKTIDNNDLVKSKYWNNYLVRSDSERYPEWTPGSEQTVVEAGYNYRTHTNPITGSVASGWLNDVLGRDLYVRVILVQNGTVETITNSVEIGGGCIVNTTTGLGYPTIQDAIDAIETLDGHTISVCAGDRTETIDIDKNLTIIGPNAGTDPNTATRVSEAVLLDGKINILGANTVVIDGLKISQVSNSTPISLGGNAIATIQNCVIERNATASVSGGPSNALGIEVSNGSGLKNIKNNLFTGDASSLWSGTLSWNSGMYINGPATQINVEDNVFENCRTALNIDDMAAGIAIANNTFSNCGTFISFGGTVPTTGSFTLGSNNFTNVAGTIINLSNVAETFRLDITSSKLDGTVFSNLDLQTLFNVEKGMYHRNRSGKKGLVYYVVNNLYVRSDINNVLQDAIDYAAAGDIVNVAAGIFNQSFSVNQSVTLLGANANVDPCSGSRGAESVIQDNDIVIAADNVIINGFEITGTDAQIRSDVNGATWSNIDILYNYIHATTAQQPILHGFGKGGGIGTTDWDVNYNKIEDINKNDATAIALFNITDLDVTYNCINHTETGLTGNQGRRGMNIDGGQTVTIANNTIDMGLTNPVQTPPDYPNFYAARYPLQISQSDRPSTAITIENNDLKGSYDGIVTLGNNDVTGLTIQNNTFSHSIYAIRLRAGTNSAGNLQSDIDILNNDFSAVSRRSIMFGSLDPDVFDDILITNNSITGGGEKEIYVEDDQSLVSSIDATCNWWGTADGDDIAAKVTGDVDISSWLVVNASGTVNPWWSNDTYSCDGTPVEIVSAEPVHIICDETVGSILVTFSGESADYEIDWGTSSIVVTNDNPYTISGLSAGNYTITVTDANGSSDVITAEVLDLPVTLSDASSALKDYYPTITAAIGAASDNDIIDVCAGTYTETLDLLNKTLTINGAGTAQTIIDADGISGYAIQKFGDGTTITDLQLLNSQHYGFKAYQVDDLTLTNILVNNSAKTGIDLNVVSNSLLTNVVVNNTIGGFGVNMINSNDITVNGVQTSGNAWGGVTVQTYGGTSPSGSNNIVFTGAFDASEDVPLLLEQDPDGAVYYPITNVTIPDKFDYVVYGLRSGPDYMQWFYQETLADAKAYGEVIATSATFTYLDVVDYNIEETTYWVTPNLLIQDAIDAATANDLINVDAGTFNENVLLNKSVTVQGSGPVNTILTPSTSCTGTGVVITADNAKLKDLKVTNYQKGVTVSAATNEINNVEMVSNCIYGMEMNLGIANLSVLNSKINNNPTGFRKGSGVSVDGFEMINCEVKGASLQGCYITGGTGPGNIFTNVSIKNSDFSNNLQKGMYFEALSNAVFDGIIMDNSGTDPNYGFNAGIDINLKYGDYSDITIQNSEITNCGVNGTATALDNPVVVTIKARDDGSYASNPATLDDVTVINNLISGPQNGLRFGEFGNTNAGPTNVVVNNNDLGTAFSNFALINNTNANMDANCNWWGTTASGTIASKISGLGSGIVDTYEWLVNGTDDNNVAVGFQPVPLSCSGTPVAIESAIADNIICGETEGSITVTFTGGTGPYNIIWDSGSDAYVSSPYIIDVTVAQMYDITITDNLGSSDKITAEVLYQPVENVTQSTYHTTIQAAITAATAGDVIEVCAGEYTGSILVDKEVTLLGPNAAISPNTGSREDEAIITGDIGNATAAIRIGASNVTIKGFKITGITGTQAARSSIGGGHNFVNYTQPNNVLIEKMLIDDNDAYGIYTNGHLIMDKWTIHDNKIVNLTSGGWTAINPWKQTNLEITNNVISNIGYGGINISDVQTALVDGNTVSDIPRQGIQIAYNTGYSTSNITVSNNIITNTNTGGFADRGAIRLYGSSQISGFVNITNNILTNSFNGIAVKAGVELPGNVYLVNNNSITGNSNKAIYHGGTGTLNATCNWFGSTNPATIAGLVQGDVNFTPWLIDGTDNSTDVGFQYAGSCDIIAPTVYAITPTDGSYVSGEQTFVFDFADASALAYLELDIYRPEDDLSTRLQFTLPADNTQIQTGLTLPEVIDAGITAASYDPSGKKWSFTINTTNGIWPDGSTRFYYEVSDVAGNKLGDMNGPTELVSYVFDNTAPAFVGVTPVAGEQCLNGENFVWTVQANDENLYELEIDHNISTLTEFSVYASNSHPYGGDEALFAAAGVDVIYDAIAQQWSIDFGPIITQQFIDNGGITFYAVLKDEAGNQWGTMNGTTPENTFAYPMDNTAPVLVDVTPAIGAQCLVGENFVWTVQASDANLYSLEVDHSFEGTIPEFSVYASEENPYGTLEDKALFEAAGVEVNYTAASQQWTIDFGADYTQDFIDNGGVTFYAVLEDCNGNEWGTMYGTTPENTFVYTFDNEAPVLGTVTPATGPQCLQGANFIWTVQASDDNLYSLEVDHNMPALPEFTVYADALNPYGTPQDADDFDEAGVTVTYDATAQKWTIDFGSDVTDMFTDNGSITFYTVIRDCNRNAFGSMDPTSLVNTFGYTFDKEAPVITLNGAAAVSICQNEAYTDAGAEATDNCDDDPVVDTDDDGFDAGIPGKYTFTYNATDLAGNVAAEVTRTVTVHPLPTAVLSGTQSVCADDNEAKLTVTLTGEAPWTFSYTDGTNTYQETAQATPHLITVNPTANTTYNLVGDVTDDNGCSNVATGEAKIYYGPVTTAPEIVTCPGEQQIEVPITVESFSEVRDLSLVLKYDASVMSYAGFENGDIPFDDIGGISVSNIPADGDNYRIIISKPSSGLDDLPTLNDGEVLLKLIFNYDNGNTDLTWVDTDDSWCSYSYLNTDGDPKNWQTEWFCDEPTSAYYNNGSVRQLGGADNAGNTGAAISAIDDIRTVTGTPVIIPVEVSYPDLAAMEVGSDVLTDAKISTILADGFPAGAQVFDITYNGTSVLTSEYDLTGKSEVLLSEILGSAPTSLLGHSGQTVNWEFYVDGITSSVTIPVSVEALAYFDIQDCATVLDEESFNVTFDNATLTMTETVEVCEYDPLVFEVNIEYPVISNLNTAVKANAKITAASALPANTLIAWDYNNGAASGNYPLPTSTDEILLSTIVGTLPASLQGHAETDVWTLTISNAGLMTANVVTVEALAVLDGVNYGHATDQVSLTVHPTPVVTDVTMDYSTDGGSLWTASAGDFAGGLALCMDPVTYTGGYYHLDIDALASTQVLEEGVLNPFFLSSDPGTAFDSWWTAKMSGWPQNYINAIQPILAGTAPMFYIKKVGSDYKLIDGFQYALDLTEVTLRLNSDYPVGTYTFSGKVTDVNGCVSEEFDVDLDITHNSTYAFSYAEPANICAATEFTLPVTFGTAIEGGCGYDGVRFKITATGAGNVTMGAYDSNNTYYSFINNGFWGPASGFDLPAGHSATTEWDVEFSAAGAYTITFSLVDAVTEDVIAGITESVNVTINALPEVTDVTMQYSTDGGSAWTASGGDLDNGYALCMDPVTYSGGYYHLDINTLASTLALEEGVLNPFFLTADPGTAFDSWWTAKMSGWPQNYINAIQPILAGTAPMFYIKKVGSDYKLIDGFQYALDLTEVTLRLNSDYPVGTYTFSGKVTDVNGCVSEEFSVNLNLTHNSTYAFGFTVPASICAATGFTLPVTFGTDDLGGCGYDNVRFKITATGDGNVTMGATDSQNNYYSFTNNGYWGPASGFDLPAGHSATTEWDVEFSAAGAYTITFSLVDAVTEDVIAGITESVNVTINALPEVTDVTMLYSSDNEGTWASSGGDFAGGFALCMDPVTYTGGYYHLDINALASTQVLEEGVLNPFFLSSVPGTAFDSWWTAKMSGWPQNYINAIQPILAGTAPMFYIKKVGSDYKLIDGFQYALDLTEVTLRLNSDYPVGTYTFSGKVTDVNGCVSEEFDVDLDITHNSTYAFSYAEPANICAATEFTLPVTFGTAIEGGCGYDGVRFKITATGAGNVTMGAYDSNNTYYSFINNGFWGPASGFDLPAGHSATTEWDVEFSAAGAYTITFSLVDAVTEDVIAGITESVNVTINALPEVTDVTMQYSTDGGSAWTASGGDLDNGYALCMDPVTYSGGYYHLDINTLASTLALEEGVLNPFFLTADPGTAFDSWWTAKMSGWPQNYINAIQPILAGTAPMFYIKKVGSDYKLIDGFQYALDLTEVTLRLNSDYPVGTYTFSGKVTDVNGCVSEEFSVNLNLTHNSTYAFGFTVPASICAATGFTLPVTFGTDDLGGCGYDNVRFKITATGDGNVTMGATDSQNNYYSFTNNGYWGPASGFDLPAGHSATTEWDVEFSAAGAYTITFSLVDAVTEDVIAGITESVNVTINALPEVTDVTMLYSSDNEGTWASSGGDFAGGFALCMDPVTYTGGYYHLDINALASTQVLEEGVLNPFFLSSDPGTAFEFMVDS